MKSFKIGAGWRNRPETPSEIARRLRELVKSLREITPHFSRWYHLISDDNMPELDETENWLVSAVAADVCKDDLGAPAPAYGYFTITGNSRQPRPPGPTDVCVHTHAGSPRGNSSQMVAITDVAWEPALVTYPVVRQTVLAFSRAFEPLWCEAGPASLWEDMNMYVYKEGPVLTPAWMVHLSPPLAERITPPTDVSCERFADGSLLLSVTEQTFDPDNAEHVAAAHRLFAVLDPLQEKKPRAQWR